MARNKNASADNITGEENIEEKTKSAVEGDSEKIYVKTERIARLFGLSVRRIQQLTQEGILHTVKVNEHTSRKYDLDTTVREYVAYVTAKAKGKDGNQIAELKSKKLEAETRLKEIQGEMSQLRTDIVRGNYVPVDNIKRDYERFFTEFRKFAMSFSGRVSGLISGYVEPDVARSIESDLSRDIASTLRGFADKIQSKGGGV